MFFQQGTPQPGDTIKIVDHHFSITAESDEDIPEPLKGTLETKGNVNLSDVEVAYNSSKPGEYGAEAFSIGNKIHLAPGKEGHLEHEARHVVQKKQGKVKADGQLKDGTKVNTDPALEKEADVNENILGIPQDNKSNPLSAGQTLSKDLTPPNIDNQSPDKQKSEEDTKASTKDDKVSPVSQNKDKTTSLDEKEGNVEVSNLFSEGASANKEGVTNTCREADQTSVVEQSSSVSTGGGTEGGDLVSQEYLKFENTFTLQIQYLHQSQELRKQTLQTQGETAKATIQTGIDAQIARSEASYSQTIEHIKNNAEAHRAEIMATRDAKIAVIDAQTLTKLAELDTVVEERKNHLLSTGDAKADAMMAIGENEAKRALETTRTNKERIQNLSNQKVRIIRQEGGSEDEIKGFLDNIFKMKQKLQESGNDIASIARRDAKEAADKFKSEANEMTLEFDSAHWEAKVQVQSESESAKENLGEISHQAMIRLDEISQGLLRQITGTRDQQTPLLQQLATGAGHSIDESINVANEQLDTQKQAQIEELETFAAQFEVASGYGKIFGEMEADITERVAQFDQKMDEYSSQIAAEIEMLVTQTIAEATVQVDMQEQRLQELLNNYDQEISKLLEEVLVQSDEVIKGHVNRIDEVIQALVAEFTQSINEADAKWSEEFTDYQNQLIQKVTDALSDQNESVSDFVEELEEEIGEATQDNNTDEVFQGFFSWLADAVLSFFEGLWGVIVGFFEAAWEVLKAIWEAIKTPLFWIIVAVAAVLIIIAAVILTIVTGGAFLVALVTVLTVVAKALLIIGAIVGGASALYFLYLAFTTEGLTPYERGKLIGKALFEVVLVVVDLAVFVKAIKWFGWLGKFANVLDKVGDVNTAMRLIRKVDDIENLLKLLGRIEDGAKLLKLLDKAGDTGTLLKLLDKVGEADKLLSLLEKVGNGKKLLQLLDKVSEADKLLNLLDKAGDVAKLLKLFDKVSDADKLLSLLDKVNDADKLLSLLDKVSDADKLLSLLDKVGDADKLLSLLNKVSDINQLERLLNVTDNVIQLEKLLQSIPNPTDLENLINTAGLGTSTIPDALRLERALDGMGSGTHSLSDIQNALDAQKVIDGKIVKGVQKDPHLPGTVPVGSQRKIIGGHSADILTDPNFQIVSQTTNADSTITAKFKKLLHVGPPAVWSQNKASTLAPPSWSHNDIFRAGDYVAQNGSLVDTATDGRTLWKAVVNGVEWQVIKDATDKITSSFPTGGGGGLSHL